MNETKDSPRTRKAQRLIDAGRVRLHPGRGTATVRGDTGTYTIRRDFGCDCPDHQLRGVECAHMIAARELCGLYRQLSAAARAGMKVRIPVELVAALGGIAPEPPPCPAHGDPAPCHWCREEAFERDLATRCMTCGERLTVDGRCPRRAERMAA